MGRGLYVHIPFCVEKCSYCDFYSLPARLGALESYVRAVVQESQSYIGLSFQTLYLGGGTPSLLGTKNLKDLIGGIRKSLDLSGLVEATIEVNPESATREFLETVKDAGVNRVSFGVQSLSDDELKSVGRIHTATQAISAIKLAKRLGFKAISADLIIGLPGQTWATLRESLETLVGLGIGHLSVYCLSLEEGTPLAENPPDDLISDDIQAEFFEKTRAFLDTCGFVHYEISNFAIEGYECLHNLNYWRGGEYLGLGPSAASHLHGKRFRNRADLDAYLENPTGQTEYIEELEAQDKAAEEAMLRLRLLTEGIDSSELTTRFGHEHIEAIISRLDGMVGEGLLTYENSRYRLVPSRIITSNQIFARIL
ncbi:MAG: radical SAM family heme chaperone HemW [Chloroflexi bacterium]|nr:radical SAM family heme chaperone HemW [Chloroflexota bacterium]